MKQDVDVSSELGKHQDTHKKLCPSKPDGYDESARQIESEPPQPVPVEREEGQASFTPVLHSAAMFVISTCNGIIRTLRQQKEKTIVQVKDIEV